MVHLRSGATISPVRTVTEVQQKVPKTSKSEGGKSGHLSSKQQLLNKIIAEKEAAHHKHSIKFWIEKIVALKKLPPARQLDHLEGMRKSKEFTDPFIFNEVQLYRLHLQLKIWIDDPDRESEAVRDRYTVVILRLIKNIADQGNITPAISKALSSVLIALGFADYVATLASPSKSEIPDRPINFEFVKLLKSKNPYYEFMRIDEHPVVWQLRLFGEYMDRSMNSRPDPRVKFEPDEWQRHVLDSIDADASLLVVGQCSRSSFTIFALNCVPVSTDKCR